MKTSTEPAAPALRRYRCNGPTMGSRYTALYYAPCGLDSRALELGLQAAVGEVDRQMSTWKPDSELNRLNAAAPGRWIELPWELTTVLAAALEVGRQSGDAFDINVGALVDAWGFGPRGEEPDARAVARLLREPRVSAAAGLELDVAGRRARKHAALALDLSGIAKGFGVDRLAHCLERYGIEHYLVGIDGEMRARGCKPDGEPWAVAMERPVRGLREVMGVMALTDAAIATSGDYRRWVELGGECLPHTMQPARQGPLRSPLAAVSVVVPAVPGAPALWAPERVVDEAAVAGEGCRRGQAAPPGPGGSQGLVTANKEGPGAAAASCMLADAWATALMVLGPREGAALARERGLQALFVLRHGEGFRELAVGPAFE